MSRAPLRYAGWMARDIATGPGAIMVAVALLVTFILWRMTNIPSSHGDVSGLVRAIVDQAAMPFVLLATGGIVSGDLVNGYYRSYFSRPVSPVAYYLQRWLLGAAAVLLFIPILAAGIALRTGTFAAPAALFAKVGLLYLMLGGLVLLASTLTRRDWIVALVIYVFQSILHSIAAAPTPGATVRTLHAILPPFHAASVKAPMPEGAALLHPLLYGLGLVLAALAVIRWRPLGSGGRA